MFLGHKDIKFVAKCTYVTVLFCVWSSKIASHTNHMAFKNHSFGILHSCYMVYQSIFNWILYLSYVSSVCALHLCCLSCFRANGFQFYLNSLSDSIILEPVKQKCFNIWKAVHNPPILCATRLIKYILFVKFVYVVHFLYTITEELTRSSRLFPNNVYTEYLWQCLSYTNIKHCV